MTDGAVSSILSGAASNMHMLNSALNLSHGATWVDTVHVRSLLVRKL
jgi:hypothetical protein